MSDAVLSSLITGGCGLLGLVPALWFRRRKSKSAVVIRRSLDRQEALETYVFTLRRQLNALGRKPHLWPRELVYLNRDDHDEQVDDEQS